MPLNATKRQIRLAKLAPSAEFNRPASCTLETVSLDENPEYEAISYAWGDPNVTTFMTLQGAQWPITINLDLALRYLRDDHVEKIFWVDAICINQLDTNERSSQVLLMRDNFSKASAVRVWLGECSDRSACALRLLEDVELAHDLPAGWEMKRTGNGTAYYVDHYTRLSTWEKPVYPLPAGWEEKEEDGTAYYVDHNTRSATWIRPTDLHIERERVHDTGGYQGPLLFNENDPKAFADIALLPWWRRLWVVQEMFLAETGTYQLGKNAISFSKCVTGCPLFHGIYQSHYVSVDRCYNTGEAEECRSFHMLGQSLTSLRSRKQHQRLSEDWHHFVVVLGRSRSRIAREDRDKVYGFLGLCPAALRDRTSPDYTSPLKEVYQNFAFHIISESESLAIFSQTMPSQNLTPGLPSWVPDWTSNYDFHWVTRRLTCYQGFFKSYGEHTLKASLVDDRILQLEGVLIDTILHTGTALPVEFSKYSQSRSILLDWQSLCGVDSSWKKKSRYVMGGSLQDALWRTMLSNIIVSMASTSNEKRRSCEAGDWQRFHQWFRDLEGSKIPRDVEMSYSQGIACWGRRLIVSAKGYIGLAPLDTAPGDKICILAGSDFPYILRSSPNAARRNTFTLVGEGAYIHGIMDGQAFTSPSTVAELSPQEQLRLKAFGGRPPDPDTGYRVIEGIFIE